MGSVTYTHGKPTNPAEHQLLPSSSVVKFSSITFESFQKRDGTVLSGTFTLTATTTAGNYTLSGTHDGCSISGDITIKTDISGNLSRSHPEIGHTEDTGTFSGTHG